MESTMQNRGCLCAQVIFLAALVLLCCATGAVNGTATGTFKKLLVFGDSYVDTGNRDPNNATYTPIGPVNQAWRPPYGRTRPGRPDGHFSDGDVLSEFLGTYMGLNPATYRKYRLDSSTPTADGMNFAVGGSGVFNNLGFTKTRDQIAQFKALLDANVFDRSSVFSESVILFAISGNDYASSLRTGLNLTIVSAVVDQMVQDLKSLYVLGFRNFVISELPPLECLPSVTATTEYTACVEPLASVPLAHNLNLTIAIALKFPPSSQANFIFLDNQAAFYYVIKPLPPLANGSALPLKPCCVAQPGALCGDLDSNNNPRYTLCDNSSSPTPFFWDENHPTQAGWGKVFRLYVDNVLYTHLKSLPAFLGVK